MTAAIAQMIAGEIFGPDDFFAPEAGTRGAATGLTPRETDVLRGISAGQSNKEIACNLDIQEVTFKLHVKRFAASYRRATAPMPRCWRAIRRCCTPPAP